LCTVVFCSFYHKPSVHFFRAVFIGVEFYVLVPDKCACICMSASRRLFMLLGMSINCAKYLSRGDTTSVFAISWQNIRSCKMRCFCDKKAAKVFFQVSSFQPTRKSPRHMLPKRGPCLARHKSTSAGGSPAADSPPTRTGPAPASGPEAMPPRRSPRLVEDLHCNRPASQGNSSPAKSSARVKA